MSEGDYKSAYERRSLEAQRLLDEVGRLERDNSRLRQQVDDAARLVTDLTKALAECEREKKGRP
jgi:IS1 family transposase